MTHNLADDPDCADVLQRMRQELHQWQLQTRDMGLMSEYEMHGRAENSTQYDVGQTEEHYPLSRILPVAELATCRRVSRIDDDSKRDLECY